MQPAEKIYRSIITAPFNELEPTVGLLFKSVTAAAAAPSALQLQLLVLHGNLDSAWTL